MFFPITVTNEQPGEFFVYDSATDRRVVTGSVNGQTWSSAADRLQASGSARNQYVWLRSRHRAGIIAELSTTDPFEYTDDKSASTWSGVDIGTGSVYAAMYNPDADRIVAACVTGAGHPIVYSDDGGATWSSDDFGTSGAIQLSWGSWGRTPGRYVFCQSVVNVGVQNSMINSTNAIDWNEVIAGMDGTFGEGIATIRYSSRYEKYISTAAGGNAGNTRKFYTSSTGSSAFTSVIISADDVPWFDCIEVNGVIISVAGNSVVTPTTSNLCARSTDGGANFTVAASMPASRRWSYLAYNGSVIACVAANAAFVAVTTDLGASWNEYALPWTPAAARIGAFYSMPV